MTSLRTILLILLEKKIFLVALGLVLLIVGTGLYLLLRNTAQTTPPPPIDTFPTEAPIPTTPERIGNVSIMALSPIANSRNILPTAPIKLSFVTPLTAAEKQQITVSSTPLIQGNAVWESDTVFAMTPTRPMNFNTRYTIKVFVGSTLLRQWSFATSAQPPLPVEEQAKTQAVGDKQTADFYAGVDTAYPWNDRLPLQKPEYFVYFDVQKKTFEATIYPKKAPNQSVDAIKRDITTQLTALGVNVSSYTINWKIL